MHCQFLFLALVFFVSCRQYVESEPTEHEYTNISNSDSLDQFIKLAVTNEEYLQYGADVAYVTLQGDTLIPFGQFAYMGTDTMTFYANVIPHPNDSTFGRPVGINSDAEILFDLVLFDNGPDYFSEGLTRVKRNGKMGYANEKGEVVIPCQYDFAGWFENGRAKVTFDAKFYYDMDEHLRVESDFWFEIDNSGNRISPSKEN